MGEAVSTWKHISTAPRDGTRILADDGDGEPYITAWTDDAYKAQSGSGGPSGWFSGKYRDHWGDDPILDHPIVWTEVPIPTRENYEP